MHLNFNFLSCIDINLHLALMVVSYLFSNISFPVRDKLEQADRFSSVPDFVKLNLFGQM